MKYSNLDIIIVGYNEANNLLRCLESVIASSINFEQAIGIKPKIYYVDSCSTDCSVEIARGRNINILFAPGSIHTASNGRATGFLLSTGEYIMFLDADMELSSDWLINGINFLVKNNLAGGVAGIRNDRRLFGSKFSLVTNYNNVKRPIEIVNNDIGGAFMFSRKALEAIGGFEPGIPSDEENVLYCQLKKAGWELFRINRPMVTHWNTKISNSRLIITRLLINKRATVPGAILRYALFNTNWWMIYLFKFKASILIHLVYLLILAVVLFIHRSSNFSAERSLKTFFVITLIYGLFIFREKRDFWRSMATLFLRTVYLFNFAIGFILGYPKLEFGVQFKEEYKNMIYALNKAAYNKNTK